jgi:excisionase family DNA binding protein
MKNFPYPITIRIINNYIELQVPDFGVIKARKKFSHLNSSEELGNIIIETIKEINDRCNYLKDKRKKIPQPSKPREYFSSLSKDVFMTTKDVEEILSISHETVRRLTNSGILQCIKTTGGHRRFKRDDVEKLLFCSSI